jgi:hypothetical protein
LRGGEKPLFTRKEVFPLPTPHPFSRKAGYLLREKQVPVEKSGVFVEGKAGFVGNSMIEKEVFL